MDNFEIILKFLNLRKEKEEDKCICTDGPNPKRGSDVCCPIHGNPERCAQLTDLIYKEYNHNDYKA